MMATTYYRWLILPIGGGYSGPSGTYRAPKYVETESRLDAYRSAGPIDPQTLTDLGWATLTSANDTDEWRITLAWGEGTDAWNALNEIHANHLDTDTLADYGQEVQPILDNLFGERDDWDVIYEPNGENSGQ